MRPSGTPQELEQRRLRAVRLLGEGFSPVEVARQIGVDRRSVRRWKAAARHGGASAVAARPASGRPRRRDRQVVSERSPALFSLPRPIHKYVASASAWRRERG